MSPKMVLVWMSWAFILTSFVSCETIEDALHNVFRRLTYIENAMADNNRNSNANCNTNKISIGRRNSLNGETATDGALGDNESDEDLPTLRNNDELNDDSANRRGYKLKKTKRRRGRYNNRDRSFSVDSYYPHTSGSAADLDTNMNTNRNVNKNRNVNINKNVISRRSDHGTHRVAIPAEHDSVSAEV
ncbi:putative mediator of RNA polymerase II transcription subunit 29 [Cephus cinctus]|uniref:Mediator of RNA polymerase II transcription subunit 29 n=1 Tax=Cephus cinctus TaxID=211228 RepID=A0AAJ7BJP2_CEPCN|nr:putative mediator of RNA polymerase II transcription subunit 29 [Cephus cinctus]